MASGGGRTAAGGRRAGMYTPRGGGAETNRASSLSSRPASRRVYGDRHRGTGQGRPHCSHVSFPRPRSTDRGPVAEWAVPVFASVCVAHRPSALSLLLRCSAAALRFCCCSCSALLCSAAAAAFCLSAARRPSSVQSNATQRKGQALAGNRTQRHDTSTHERGRRQRWQKKGA
jgi:hypothetical protein